MDAPQQNLISATARECKELLNRDGVYVQLDILNTAYTEQITQEAIDSVASFKAAGLTVAQFQAAVYALKMCHLQIVADLRAVVVVANL